MVEPAWMTFERAVAGPIQSLRGPVATHLAEFITNLGSPWILGLVTASAVLIPSRLRLGERVLVGLNAVDASLLNEGLKNFFQRPRPSRPLVVEPGYSFPSGHSMISLCIYVFLAYLALVDVRRWKRRLLLTVGLALLIVSIGISRIYLAAHYPGDVMGGFTAGWPCVWLHIVVHRRLYRKAPVE